MDVEHGLMNAGKRWRAIPDQSCQLFARQCKDNPRLVIPSGKCLFLCFAV